MAASHEKLPYMSAPQYSRYERPSAMRDFRDLFAENPLAMPDSLQSTYLASFGIKSRICIHAMNWPNQRSLVVPLA